MKLRDLLKAVEDKNLTKAQVEEYYDDLTHVFSKVCMEVADLKKREALFFDEHMRQYPDDSDARIKRLWRITPEGQRLIELEAYKTVLPRELASLKNRIYSLL